MNDAVDGLTAILRGFRELLARPGNNFDWSSWEDADAALVEVDRLLASLDAGRLPAHRAVAVLFLPTGPAQEVALSSGWGDEFEAVAGRFDEAEKRLWP